MDVIRRAIIEIETRQKKTRLEAPEVSAAERAYKVETEAAAKATQSIDQATQATKRHAETVRSSSRSMLSSFREAGEGAFRFGRGLALLSASGSEDLRKLVQTVALAQGAFDVFAGSSKIFTSLAAVLGGPVAIAVTGITTAVGAGAIAWRKWSRDAQEAADQVAAQLERLNRLQREGEALGRQRARERRETLFGLELGFVDDPLERRRLLRTELLRERGALRGAQRFIDEQGPRLSAADTGLIEEHQRTISRSAERQLELTKQLVDIERPAFRGITAATQGTLLGALAAPGFAGAPLGQAGILSAPFGIGGFQQTLQEADRLLRQTVLSLHEIAAQSFERAELLKQKLNETNPR